LELKLIQFIFGPFFGSHNRKHYVQTSYTEFQPYRSLNVKVMDRNPLRSLRKVWAALDQFS